MARKPASPKKFAPIPKGCRDLIGINLVCGADHSSETPGICTDCGVGYRFRRHHACMGSWNDEALRRVEALTQEDLDAANRLLGRRV